METDDWLTHNRNFLDKSFKNIYIIMFFTMLIPFVALYIPILKPSDELLAFWFQRSGSIIVVLALWIELKNNKANSLINPRGFITEEFEVIKKEYGKRHSFVTWFGFWVAIIGSIIWGYGDILFKLT